MEGAGLAPRFVSVLGLLGVGVHTRVFGFLVGAVRCVEGGGPEGGVVEVGVWEVPLCCPCVQGGRGGPFRLYGVSLVVSATGDEDVGGRQLIHLCGVAEVAGDGDLGGVVLAGGGAHRFLNSNLSVNSEMHNFRIPIISADVPVEKILKIIVNFLLPKSLWFEFHRQSRTVPACNCRGTDRRKMKVKEMPFSQNLPLGE